ncbi:putative oxidoreductase YqjQ [Phytophthora nicotianae]|uniref:Oxidoreductase YqjQ n=1 Tax=Phytophthora nicotianae TaxID=4792 RepID=A0A0W8CUJ6_PHYNI|nr:putative oxidoreductase YqjQ [Phytophthora nicotianae]
MEEAYKKLKDIQKYQIFTMRESNPGVVKCRKGPDSDEVTQDLRLPLQNPPPNSEKIQFFYNKVRPFVPEEFQNDPLYDPPNDEDERTAKQIQKDRQAASKQKKREREAAAAAAKITKETPRVTETTGEAM